ncbi:thiol:disulfide interchange protein DsbA/DsbL [Burkholderia ambifaria]|uniref:thiol:disulfide interchange protein DsbA/DsbL n=1 Tax=Burkholderia ambifaria TaxID=152480 RepID=UPI00158FEE87|nr:thiol:disulfide interchange protein DsbA/DsbL [Burkholderia ambifaria]
MKMEGLTRALVLGLALLGTDARAALPVAPSTYRVLSTPLTHHVTTKSGQVEVVEFFWYGCRFCGSLEPKLNAWLDQRRIQQKEALTRMNKPVPPGWKPDVAIRRIPVMFADEFESYARLYYALEALGQAQRLAPFLYDAVQKDRKALATPHAQAMFLTRHGVDPKAFLRAYHSSSTQRALERDQALVRAVGVDSVPSLLVQGRWQTGPQLTHGPEGTLRTLDALVDLARANQS